MYKSTLSSLLDLTPLISTEPLSRPALPSLLPPLLPISSQEMESQRDQLATASEQSAMAHSKAGGEMQRSLSKLRNTLKKSRAKSDAYKRKAIKGHQREQLLREQLRQLVQRAEGDRKRFENEMGRLKSDLLNRATRSSENAGKENGDQLAGGGGGGGGDKFSVLVEQHREQRQEIGRFLQRLDALT